VSLAQSAWSRRLARLVRVAGALISECVGGVSRTLRDNEKERESVRLTPAISCRHSPWSELDSCWLTGECPRQDSNLRTRLRRPLLYPLSYGGVSGALRGDG
jgi:hypothetical protein